MRNPFSRVSDPNSFHTDTGSPVHMLYAPSLNADGTISLEVSEIVDIRKEINSYRDQCDMRVILDRLSAGLPVPVTNKSPMYGDFTQFPKTYAEMFDLVTRSESAFDSLPSDVKQKFNNSRGEWFASIGSRSWFDKMGFESPGKVQPGSPGSDKSSADNSGDGSSENM